jgi:hypothetical protein
MNFLNIRNDSSSIDDNNNQIKSFKWKGVAVWLIENTAISFKQISNFCGLNVLEVEALANDETGESITPHNPILMQLLDSNTIDACSLDPTKPLILPPYNAISMKLASQQSKTKYVTMTKKKDKPDAIAWILKNHPYVSDGQIIKLIGTTKNTIQSIRDKTYKGTKTLKPRNPVVLGMCNSEQLENMIMYAKLFYDRMKIENDEKHKTDNNDTI